jgi:hypothetical protein
MSKISTAYDQVLSTLAILFPDKERLPRPKTLDKNDANWLVDGYGVYLDGSTASDFQEVICDGRYRRSYSLIVVLTRVVDDLESDTSEFDTQVKNLLEDVKSMFDLYYVTGSLGTSTVERTDLLNTSSIEDIFTEDGSYITINTTFNLIISENIP